MAEQPQVSAVPGEGGLGADQPAAVGARSTSKSQEEDEESEWEYEYSATETDVGFEHQHRRATRLTFSDVLPDSGSLLPGIQKRGTSESASQPRRLLQEMVDATPRYRRAYASAIG